MAAERISVVYNACHGGFGLSKEAKELLSQKRTAAGLDKLRYLYKHARTDPHLIEVVQELGEKANDRYSKLRITSIPIEYEHCFDLDEYDGLETVVCDPAQLIRFKLSELNMEQLSDQECRETLLNLVKLATSEQ
jgi:hypothetical protein